MQGWYSCELPRNLCYWRALVHMIWNCGSTGNTPNKHTDKRNYQIESVKTYFEGEAVLFHYELISIRDWERSNSSKHKDQEDEVSWFCKH